MTADEVNFEICEPVKYFELETNLNLKLITDIQKTNQ